MRWFFFVLFLMTKFSLAVDYIDKENYIRQGEFNVLKTEKVEIYEKVSRATKNITDKLVSPRCLQYNREPNLQEKEKILKAMIATHLIYSHLNFTQLYKTAPLTDKFYTQHVLVLKMVHQAIQISLTHLVRYYEYIKIEDLFNVNSGLEMRVYKGLEGILDSF